MAIFMVQLTAPGAYTAADAPNVVIPFKPKRILIVNQDVTPANTIQVSVDGAADCANLIPGINPQLELRQQTTRLWIKRAAAGGAVMVLAEDTSLVA